MSYTFNGLLVDTSPRLLCFLVLVMIPTCMHGQCNFNCPPCYNNAPPRPGHGTNSSNQVIVNVGADSTWSSQQLTVISQAITDACNAWNSQATCGPLHYYFQPVTRTSSAGVIVTLFNDQDTCGRTALNSISGATRSSVPDQIQLMSKDANNEASAARFIEHELGHVSGVGNSIDTPQQCSGAQSIMSIAAPVDTCLSTNVSITAKMSRR